METGYSCWAGIIFGEAICLRHCVPVCTEFEIPAGMTDLGVENDGVRCEGDERNLFTGANKFLLSFKI